MKAEERLVKTTAGQSCAHPFDQECSADLAREAIALLREYPQHSCITHSYACPAAEESPGPFDPATCDCGSSEFETSVLRFLDGDEERK